MMGQLFVHYKARDVALLFDGDSAMRSLQMFRLWLGARP